MCQVVLLGNCFTILRRLFMDFTLYLQDFMEIFIGVAVLIGILTTVITAEKSQRNDRFELEAKEAEKAILQMEYAESPEGKIDQAIEKAKLKKHEQRRIEIRTRRL